MESIPILKTYVYHKDGRCWYVSTIERNYEYDADFGMMRGRETIIWEWDPETKKQCDMIGQFGPSHTHFDICINLLEKGELPDD
jgi:nuclear transport factor 2 (NTF2) superfamily protein